MLVTKVFLLGYFIQYALSLLFPQNNLNLLKCSQRPLSHNLSMVCNSSNSVYKLLVDNRQFLTCKEHLSLGTTILYYLYKKPITEEIKSKRKCQIDLLASLAQESDAPQFILDFIENPVTRKVGYWAKKNSDNPENLPIAEELLDTAKPDEIELIINQMKNYRVLSYWLGHHVCYICADPAGTTCRTDGIRIWPESLAHYLTKHKTLPPNW